MPTAIRLHPRDNVAVALVDLPAGAIVESVTLCEPIPRGHKFAIDRIPAGNAVLKFGHPIGRAACDIAQGAHVHSHNLASDLHGSVLVRDPGAQHPARSAIDASTVAATLPRTFDGFRRLDGSVGVRNEVWIINTVGCVNRASEQIARAANDRYCGYKSCDGVFAFPHPFGCSQLGDDLLHTQKILAGLIRHPNAGAVLVLGLGCENNRLRSQLEQVGAIDADRVKFFNAQDVEDEIETGISMAADLVEWACQFRRQPIDAGELTLGMKCGGSDGLSGITANPLVGRIADRLCATGGTALLTEVPEMFGAEDVLLPRCADEQVAGAARSMIDGFRDYFRRHGQPIDENPSPGNRDGGITTLAEKSLGCVQKGGEAPIRSVLGYGDPAPRRLGGVALVDAPGNDGVSSTAMVAAGAQMLLFTTGRGTPLGLPVPTIKISSNTPLRDRKPSWIDFDAGRLLADGANADTLADELWSICMEIASGGRQSRNEINGNREIAIWKDGVTL